MGTVGLSQIRRETVGRGGDHPLAPPQDPTGSSLRLLRFERRWLVRVFETILPSGAGLSHGAADVPMGRFIDDFVRHAPLATLIGLRAALWLVMLAPLVLRRGRTFLGLAEPDRVQLLERLRRSDRYVIRESAALLKLVACLGFCGLAAVQEPLGVYPTDDTPPVWAR
jgi:hypothetical protein